MMRTCKDCGNYKPLEQFANSGIKNGKRYYRHICQKCQNQKTIEWQRREDVHRCMGCGASRPRRMFMVNGLEANHCQHCRQTDDKKWEASKRHVLYDYALATAIFGLSHREALMWLANGYRMSFDRLWDREVVWPTQWELDPYDPTEYFICTKCKRELEADEYTVKIDKRRNPEFQKQRMRMCRDCAKKAHRERREKTGTVKRNPRKVQL